MGEEDLGDALLALGERLLVRTDIVVGGAGALILTGDLPRTTTDFDVLYSNPDIGRLQDDIRAVAVRLDLTPGWMNGSIQTYLDVLPPDYQARLITLPARGNLHIALLHRQDVIVMKLFAGRPRDLTDVVALRPTQQELQFVRGEMLRLGRIDAARAKRMEGFLDRYHDAAG